MMNNVYLIIDIPNFDLLSLLVAIPLYFLLLVALYIIYSLVFDSKLLIKYGPLATLIVPVFFTPSNAPANETGIVTIVIGLIFAVFAYYHIVLVDKLHRASKLKDRHLSDAEVIVANVEGLEGTSNNLKKNLHHPDEEATFKSDYRNILLNYHQISKLIILTKRNIKILKVKLNDFITNSTDIFNTYVDFRGEMEIINRDFFKFQVYKVLNERLVHLVNTNKNTELHIKQVREIFKGKRSKLLVDLFNKGNEAVNDLVQNKDEYEFIIRQYDFYTLVSTLLVVDKSIIKFEINDGFEHKLLAIS